MGVDAQPVTYSSRLFCYVKVVNMNKKEYLKLVKNRCDKEKHRVRENAFGICWCTICGKLVQPKDYNKLVEVDKIIIK